MKPILNASAPALPLLSFTDLSTNWKLDGPHAKLRFSITHLGISDVEGSFRTIDATVTSNSEDLTNAVIAFTADAKSIDTDSKMRDEHLRGADFFDVAKYPTITFTSTAITKTVEGKYKVNGNLTMHGVIKPVELTATARFGDNPMTKHRVLGVKVTGAVDRTQFRVGGGFGGAMLSDNVEITANTEFVKQ